MKKNQYIIKKMIDYREYQTNGKVQSRDDGWGAYFCEKMFPAASPCAQGRVILLGRGPRWRWIPEAVTWRSEF